MEGKKQIKVPNPNQQQEIYCQEKEKIDSEFTSSYYDYSDEIEFDKPNLASENRTKTKILERIDSETDFEAHCCKSKREKYKYLSQLIKENHKLQEEIRELKQKQLLLQEKENRLASPKRQPPKEIIHKKAHKASNTVHSHHTYHKNHQQNYSNILELIDFLIGENKQLKKQMKIPQSLY